MRPLSTSQSEWIEHSFAMRSLATLPATPLSSGTPAADGTVAQNARRNSEFDAYTGSNEI